MKKFILLFFVILFSITSCSTKTGISNTVTTVDSDPGIDETTLLTADIPDDVNYSGYVFKILLSGN